jgi:hypothetical protein
MANKAGKSSKKERRKKLFVPPLSHSFASAMYSFVAN